MCGGGLFIATQNLPWPGVDRLFSTPGRDKAAYPAIPSTRSTPARVTA